MSCRNLFVLNFKYNPSCEELEQLQILLKQVANQTKIGIHFDINGYYEEMSNLLKLEKNYFFLSDNKEVLECEYLFDLHKAYEFAAQFKRKYFDQKLDEYLVQKFAFCNEFIEVLFRFSFVEQVEFYISTQYSIMLEDFRLNEVKGRNLLEAFLYSLKPQKREKYFGLKTCKFIVS